MSETTRIEQRPDVLGGEPVFANTRLSVAHVGKMVEGGEPIANIIEDYPYLTVQDVEAARVHFKNCRAINCP